MRWTWRFLAVDLAGAIAGDLVWLLEVAGSDVPHVALGASGAIAGLMGFTLLAAPRAEVRIFFRGERDEFPAASVWFLLGLWLLCQVLLASAGPLSTGAWSAHLGGFLAGLGSPFSSTLTPSREHPGTSNAHRTEAASARACARERPTCTERRRGTCAPCERSPTPARPSGRPRLLRTNQ